MWKVLDKYMKELGLNIYGRSTWSEEGLFYIDNLLFYHNAHLKIRKKIEEINKDIDKEFFIKKTKSNSLEFPQKQKDDLKKLVKSQKEINNYIRAFFILFIIELSKIFEVNGLIKNEINMLPSEVNYTRLQRGKDRPVSSLSELIVHFRDACVHDRSKKISKWPECERANIDGGNIHLDFVVDDKSSERVFMIGHGKLAFSTIEKIIEKIFICFSVPRVVETKKG